MVVTFPPGGSADAVVRMLVPRLNEKLGQQVVVDNRPGAGGNIGLTVVAKAPGDGYTLGVGAAGALAANSSLYPQMPFDPLKDLKPVSMLAAIPFVIVGHPSVAARTQKELHGRWPKRSPASCPSAMAATARPCTCRPRCSPDGRREAGRGAVPRLRPGRAGCAGRPGAAGAWWTCRRRCSTSRPAS
jgi:hypothetical protein